jgi:hypothetical protein
MMHMTGDGERMYVVNSSLSMLDHLKRSQVRLAHIGPVGMKVDRFINVDFDHLPPDWHEGIACC